MSDTRSIAAPPLDHPNVAFTVILWQQNEPRDVVQPFSRFIDTLAHS
jgi:hypothetical protein